MLATVLDAKHLELLHEAAPAARRIADLMVSEIRHQSTLAAMRATATTNGIELVPVYTEGQHLVGANQIPSSIVGSLQQL